MFFDKRKKPDPSPAPRWLKLLVIAVVLYAMASGQLLRNVTSTATNTVSPGELLRENFKPQELKEKILPGPIKTPKEKPKKETTP